MASRLDIKEYEYLFRTHYTQLCYFAFDMLGDIDVARDVVSDVFVQIWSQRDKVVDEGRLKSYLLVCVRNSCINHIRKTHYTVSIDDIDELTDMPSMELLEAQEERIAEMNKVIDTMKPKTQRVLMECYFNDRSYKETAEMLGITTDGVKKHIVKAFAMLRGHFKVVKGLKMLLQIPAWLVEVLYLYINN